MPTVMLTVTVTSTTILNKKPTPTLAIITKPIMVTKIIETKVHETMSMAFYNPISLLARFSKLCEVLAMHQTILRLFSK